MSKNSLYLSLFLLLLLLNQAVSQSLSSKDSNHSINNIPALIAPFFSPPPKLTNDFGKYWSPLKFYNGTPVKTPGDWQRRRDEILKTWHGIMGNWPPMIYKPKIEYLGKKRRENFTQHQIRLEIAPQQQTVDGYLLIPDGKKLFPAVLIVYYDAETAVGLRKELRDFGYQLTKSGFVTLSIASHSMNRLKTRFHSSHCLPWPMLQSTVILHWQTYLK
jgi:hypothetical protein